MSKKKKQSQNKQTVVVRVKQRRRWGKLILLLLLPCLIFGLISSLFDGFLNFKLPFELPFGIFEKEEGKDSTKPSDSESSTESNVTETTYTIRFDDSAGSGEVIDMHTTETGILETFPTVTLDGFTFVGWYDEENNRYTAPYMFAESMSLIARWETDEFYTVTFIVEGEEYFSCKRHSRICRA